MIDIEHYRNRGERFRRTQALQRLFRNLGEKYTYLRHALLYHRSQWGQAEGRKHQRRARPVEGRTLEMKNLPSVQTDSSPNIEKIQVEKVDDNLVENSEVEKSEQKAKYIKPRAQVPRSEKTYLLQRIKEVHSE